MLGLLLAAGAAPGGDPPDCTRIYSPDSGQAGKDVIWVPTSDDLVAEMLRLGRVGPDDHLIDLGSGDGKIAIAAARDFGATATGIEYNPRMIELARCHAEVEGVAGKVRFVEGDIFATDFSRATVLTLYLLPSLNLKLRPKILAMQPGTRVVSHDFNMEEWQPDATVTASMGTAYLWIVPASVAGEWQVREERGRDRFSLRLTQAFQRVGGTVRTGRADRPLVDASLSGPDLRLVFEDGSGVRRLFTGTISGNRMEATLRGRRYVATRDIPEETTVGRRTGHPAGHPAGHLTGER